MINSILSMSIALLRTLIVELKDPVVVLDHLGQLVCASPKGLRILKSDRSASFNFFECISEQETVFKDWFLTAESRDSKHFSFSCQNNTEDYTLEIHAVVLYLDTVKYCILFLQTDQETVILRKDVVSKINAIEQLARSQKIRDGELKDAVHEILEVSSIATATSRVSLWKYGESKDTIRCIGSFENGAFAAYESKELPSISKPAYFKLFEQEKIIVATDAQSNEYMQELKFDYLIPNNIQAMMDVPVRIEGEVVGVFCFEHVGSTREWTLDDQKFGLIAAQMISLAIETSEKKKLQLELEKTLKQQQNLFIESNHRVKNNLSIISSLIHLQAHNCKDTYHENLFNDLQNRVLSIISLHEMLNKTKTFETINLQLYLEDIVLKLESSFSLVNRKATIVRDIEAIEIEISKSIVLGLITNEIITNSFKHAFTADCVGIISMELFQESTGTVCLKISDNGIGFDIQSHTNTLGIEILKDLVHQLDGELSFSSKEGARFEIRFKI